MSRVEKVSMSLEATRPDGSSIQTWTRGAWDPGKDMREGYEKEGKQVLVTGKGQEGIKMILAAIEV